MTILGRSCGPCLSDPQHVFAPRNQAVTSYELMTGTSPDVANIRVFDYFGWYHVLKQLQKKLDAKLEAGIVIGCLEHSQYKLWIPCRNVSVISRDITVVEDKFPGPHVPENIEDCDMVLVSEDTENESASRSESNSPGGNTQTQNRRTELPSTSHDDVISDGTPAGTFHPTSKEQIEQLTHYSEGSRTDQNGGSAHGNGTEGRHRIKIPKP